MAFRLYGIGTATPEHFVTQSHAAQIAASFCGGVATKTTAQLLPKLYARCRVHKRHSVVLESSSNGSPATQSFYPAAMDANDRGPTTARRMVEFGIKASELSAIAARRALDDAGISADRVTHLVTVSCSGFSAPGVDVQLIERLALPYSVARTHIGFMGCHGALNALRVADGLASRNAGAVVLLVAVELCSLHQQYGWDADRVVSNALFADGAAAVVGGYERRDRQMSELVASGSTIVPDSKELMGWVVGDHGFEMTLSAKVPGVIRERLRPWLVDWLSKWGLGIEDIGSWAVHPGGPRILAATFEGLGISESMAQDSFDVLAEYGNMSSPTVLFILQRQRKRQAPLPCLMLGFGPGLAIEAALCR